MSNPTIPERMLMALADATEAVDSFSLARLMEAKRSVTIAAKLQQFERDGLIKRVSGKYKSTQKGREEGQRLKQWWRIS